MLTKRKSNTGSRGVHLNVHRTGQVFMTSKKTKKPKQGKLIVIERLVDEGLAQMLIDLATDVRLGNVTNFAGTYLDEYGDEMHLVSVDPNQELKIYGSLMNLTNCFREEFIVEWDEDE